MPGPVSIPPKGMHVGTVGGFDVYEMPSSPDSIIWVRFKLVRCGAVGARKKWGVYNSYHLSWGVDSGRLGRSTWAKRLMDSEPEAYEALLAFLRKEYGPDWLTSPTGGALTPEEVVTERLRFKAAYREKFGKEFAV